VESFWKYGYFRLKKDEKTELLVAKTHG